MKRYLTAAQVKRRYGDVSDMWLWRRFKNDPHFPKPLRHTNGGPRIWDEAELDAYDETLKQERPVEAEAAA
jgi:predicted DNA-binding transcriptional regulator AlpA